VNAHPLAATPLRDFGSIIGDAIRLYRAHFVTFFALALITVPVNMLRIVFERSIEMPGDPATGFYLFLIPDLVITLVAGGAIIVALQVALAGSSPEFRASLDSSIGRFWELLRTLLLVATLGALSVVSWPFLAFWWLVREDATIDGRRDWFLVVFPFAVTAYLLVRWLLWAQSVLIDAKWGWSALDRAAEVIRGRWWRTLLFFIVIGLITSVPGLLARTSTLAPPLVEGAVRALVASVLMPFWVTALTLEYIDLRGQAHTATLAEGVGEVDMRDSEGGLRSNDLG
jgi:hypothetical protein